MCNGSTYRHLEADTDTHTTHRSYQNKNDIKNIERHSLVSNIEPARSSLTEEKKTKQCVCPYTYQPMQPVARVPSSKGALEVGEKQKERKWCCQSQDLDLINNFGLDKVIST